MSYRKILVLLSICGTVLIGIGFGVAFAEYSSFSYSGKQNELNEETVEEYTVNIKNSMKENEDKVFYDCYYTNNIEVIPDENVVDEEMIVEVTYNKIFGEPSIDDREMHDYYQSDDNEVKVISIGFVYDSVYSDIELLMMYKDLILKDVKNRVISDYDTDCISKCIIRVSPNNIDKVEELHW